jgi:hypothetical protein
VLAPRVRQFALLTLGVLSIAAGCKTETVAIDMNYPSQEAFLRSSFARLRVFRVQEDDTGACLRIRDDLKLGNMPDETLVYDSEKLGVCDFRNQQVAFKDIPSGALAYSGLVLNEGDVPLMTGCVVRNVSNTSEVLLSLQFTDNYTRMFQDAPPPACTTVEQKCMGQCGGEN